MTRLSAAVFALLCLVPAVSASLDRPRFDARPTGIRLTIGKELFLETAEVPPPNEVQLTAETEVYLDGRRCRYKDVPAGATITRMLLAPDQKTLLRVEFSSRK